MKLQSKFGIGIALSTALLVVPATTVLGDEAPDTSNYSCMLCPVTSGWFGDWDLGAIYVSDSSLKFGDYRGLEEDGVYLDIGGRLHYRGEEGVYVDLSARDLWLDSRALKMRAGKQGRYEVRAKYSEIPRYRGYGTESPYQGVGTDTLYLSDFIQFRNGELTNLDQFLIPVALDTKRKNFGVGLTFKLGGSWKYHVDVQQEKKNGTRPFGGGAFVFSAAAFPAPVDYTTEQLNMGVEYAGKRAQLYLQYTGSDFDNGMNSVTWDNPFSAGFGDSVSRSALEPDNRFNQISLAGSFRFSRNFRVSGKASVGEAKQDDLFLPYSINPAFSNLELPRDSLNGKLDVSMFNLSARLFARLADGLDLTAQYKTSERDNQTPVDAFTPVLLDVFRSADRNNKPFSYDRSQSKVELRFRPVYYFRLNAGVKEDTVERTLQEVAETEEDTTWGEVQLSPTAWLSARFKVDNQDRGATPYMELDSYGRAQNPRMRLFNLAERDRDRSTWELDLVPNEKFGISFSYYTTEDQYTNSPLGLTASEETSRSVDLNIMLSDRVNVYVFYSEDEIESTLANAADFDADPWISTSMDEVETLGIGVSGTITDKLSYGFDYVSSESDGNILTDSGAGDAAFPTLRTSLTNTRLYLHYKVSDRWGWSLDAYHEEYESSDWTIDGIGPGDINSVLTLGEISPQYDVRVVRLRSTFSF
jgi:MtrB/PioB family decaheme-associated outer membrane protein